jgi:hypothetical protein
MRSKILGILAPVKVASTNPEGDESAPMYSVLPVPVDYRQAIGGLRPPSSGEDGDS